MPYPMMQVGRLLAELTGLPISRHRCTTEMAVKERIPGQWVTLKSAIPYHSAGVIEAGEKQVGI
jgi:hypothetical protein